MGEGKELPPPEDLPSRKTRGCEMTSGHRDKNIPSSRGVVDIMGGDVVHLSNQSAPINIATSTRAPVLTSSVNLHQHNHSSM